MILVDTSVWIGFFNELDSPTVRLLEDFIVAEEDICLSGFIVTEVLQGFKTEKDFELAKKHLLQFPIYIFDNPQSYIKAAQIYRRCRRQGITIRKTADCIIAQTAIENKLILLHEDTDFDRIASVCPLKVFDRSRL
ncbi:MAG: PIN domain nuclease [Desulfobacteraceae bacterium]|nr:MAG: PIN domain nuclease [Desulfobacteraceae bacterium]